jgi:pimeloyl-ACP methyl ester carboxylesterase
MLVSRNIRLLLLFVGAVLIAVACMWTPSAVALGSPTSFVAQSDAYVLQSYPERNYGTSARLVCSPSPSGAAYVRFLVADLDGTPVRATLRLYASRSGDGLDVRETSSVWGETAVNAPSTTADVVASVTRLKARRWVEVDVTPAVKGAGFVSFALTGPGGRAVSIGSRESSRKPQLLIETAVPSTTTTSVRAVAPTTTTARPTTTTTRPPTTTTAPPTTTTTAPPTTTTTAPPTSTTAAPALVRSLASFGITRSGSTLSVPVYVSQPLTVPDARVTRAVVVLHGLSRNVEGYWDSAAAGLKGAPGVLLVAPLFATSSDSPATTQLYWTSSGWPKGNLSESSGRPWRISSYGVLDEMIARLRSTFGSLRTVVVIGHSAGGQFVQRYAAASADAGLRFVVMNPGSYLYVSPERPDGNGGFAVPAPAPRGYDDYKYGLQNMSNTSYMASIGAAALRSRYQAAHVRYLLGELDTNPDDPDLDTSASAMVQGAHRLQRGEYFFSYLGFTFGSSIYERHELVLVPGVAHTASGMFRSAAGRAAMLQ